MFDAIKEQNRLIWVLRWSITPKQVKSAASVGWLSHCFTKTNILRTAWLDIQYIAWLKKYIFVLILLLSGFQIVTWKIGERVALA